MLFVNDVYQDFANLPRASSYYVSLLVLDSKNRFVKAEWKNSRSRVHSKTPGGCGLITRCTLALRRIAAFVFWRSSDRPVRGNCQVCRRCLRILLALGRQSERPPSEFTVRYMKKLSAHVCAKQLSPTERYRSPSESTAEADGHSNQSASE